MLRILLHSMVCLLGVGIFSKLISHQGEIRQVFRAESVLTPPADEFRFFCEEFDDLPPGSAIAAVSSRWAPHPVDSLNAVVTRSVDDMNGRLSLDSGRVATLDLSEVSLMMDNQFHLEWDLAFESGTSQFDTIYFSESTTNLNGSIAIALRSDSLKVLQNGMLRRGYAWGPGSRTNRFEVFINTRTDSAFFRVNNELLAVTSYPFAQLGYETFKGISNDYYIDNICHSVQVPVADCTCGVPGWSRVFCDAFENYFLGPFLSNNAPDWRAYAGPGQSGVLQQEGGKNHVLISGSDSIGLILPRALPQKFAFSFRTRLEAGINTGAGGGMRLFLDSMLTKEILNLRFRKNISRIESVELRVNRRQVPNYTVQDFKAGAAANFTLAVDTVSWNFNFFHDGELKYSWELPDSLLIIDPDHSLTAVYYGRPQEAFELDDICVQELPTLTNCVIAPSWEPVFCDNLDTHPLGAIESTSQKWVVQPPLVDQIRIVIPDQLEDYDPQMQIPVGGRAEVRFQLNQLNTNRFRVNSRSRLASPFNNFGGNIFLKNTMTQLVEARMNDGFFNRAGVVFLYGDTTKMANLPLDPSGPEEYGFSFLFDQNTEQLEIFFNDQFLLRSDASDSLLIRSFLQEDMILEYQAKQQPMLVEQVAVYRRLLNTDFCDNLIAAADTCMLALGDSLYTPSEACLLGYLNAELETVEAPVVSGLKPSVVSQIEALEGRVEGKTITLPQDRALELFFVLDRNSLELANNACASYTSIQLNYQGDPLTVDSCSAAFFAWDFYNSEGGVSLTHTIDLELETCIRLDSVVGIDSLSVGNGLDKFGDFGLVVLGNEDGDFDFDDMDQVVAALDYDIDFTTCNDNTRQRYTLSQRTRQASTNGRDSAFQYVLKVELYDELCGFTVRPEPDSFLITVYDTLPPTLPPLDTIHLACLDDAFAAAAASVIDTSLVQDNIAGNEDTSRIRSRFYLSNNPEFLEVTKEWTLVDSSGNEGKVFQRFIVSQEPIAFTTPDTAYINRRSQLNDTRLTGALTGISSLCGPVIDTAYTDNKVTVTACRDTIIRTWTVEDSVGNLRSHQQVIFYEDTIDPVLEGLPKVTFNRLSDTTNFAIVGIPRVIMDDHPIVDTSFVDVVSDSSRCYARIDRTWRFTDSCGNTAESRQELIFDARMDPIITGLRPEVRQQIEANGGTITGNRVEISQADVHTLTTILAANSLNLSNADCTNHEEIDFFYEGVEPLSDTSCIASDFVWRFLDEEGKVTASYALVVDVVSCIQFIATGDLIPGSVRPGLSYVDNSTLSAQLIDGEAISLTQLDSLVALLQFDIDFVSCNDNAAIRNTSLLRERLPMGSPGAACFRYSFDAEVFDEKCGFLESRPVSVNILDTIAPRFASPDTLYFPCLGDAFQAAIGARIDRSKIVDNIIGNEDLPGITDTIYENDSFPFAAVTKRWTIPDQCGNLAYAYQHFLVNQEPISVELPDTIVITRFAELQDTSVTGTIRNVFSFCGQITSVSYEDDITELGPCEETITRNWRITDNRGNVRIAPQIFLYRDTLGPELEAFAITRLDCIEDAADLDISGRPALRFDDHPDLSFSYTDQTFDSISCLRQIVRDWDVADGCGNVTSIQQIIEIDNRSAPPVIWPPSFVRVDCRPEVEDTSRTGSPIFPDYLCNQTRVAYTDNLISASPCEVLYQRNWTVRTRCGLELRNSQVIQVKDSIPPDFIAPGPVTVVASDLARLSVTGFPTNIQDNCYISNSIAFEDEWIQEVSCVDTGLVVRKLMVTDQCDNTRTVEQMIKVLPLSTPLSVELEADTIFVNADTTMIALPAGFPADGVYSGPFVLDTLFNVERAGPGTYEVFYTIGDPDSDCSFSDSVIIVVEGPNRTTDPAFMAALRIWPNPTSDEVRIRFDGIDPGAIRLKLWSGRGALLHNELLRIPGSVWDHQLSLADLPGGVYWISFETAKGYKGYHKIIKL